MNNQIPEPLRSIVNSMAQPVQDDSREQTFYVIKRDHPVEPYFSFIDYGFGFGFVHDIRQAIFYDHRPVFADMAEKAKEKIDNEPTARIVKVLVREVEG